METIYLALEQALKDLESVQKSIGNVQLQLVQVLVDDATDEWDDNIQEALLVLENAQKVVGEAHVRCVLEGGDGSRLEAIAFRAAGEPIGDALMAGGGMPLHIAGHLRQDTWGGRRKIELMIEDVADPRRQPGR